MNEIETFIENRQKADNTFYPQDFIRKHGIDTKSRKQSIAYLRHELIYRMWSNSTASTTKIGKQINRSHCTVLHSIDMAILLRNDAVYTKTITPYLPEMEQINYSVLNLLTGRDKGKYEKRNN